MNPFTTGTGTYALTLGDAGVPVSFVSSGAGVDNGGNDGPRVGVNVLALYEDGGIGATALRLEPSLYPPSGTQPFDLFARVGIVFEFRNQQIVPVGLLGNGTMSFTNASFTDGGVVAFRVEGCAVAQAHAEVIQHGSGFGGHTPNAFFVSVLSRIQDCHDADQLRTVLDARWVVNHRTLTVGGEGYEEETALHRKIRKSVFAACSALRPRIADDRLIGLLYHCAAAADGSLQSYPWPSRKEDESRLRSAQKARIGAEQRDSAAAHADFERRKDLPMAATVCRSAGKKLGSCMSACRKNYTCR